MSVPEVVAGRLAAPRRYGRERIVYPLAVAALAAAYYGAAQLGFALEVAGPVAAIVWLPVGVGVAFIYFGGNALWPGVLIGDLLANDYGALPVGTSLLQTGGNLLEVLLATALLRRVARRGPPLGSIGGLMGMIAAIAAGTAVSATIGSLAQLAGSVIDLGEAPKVWRTWWLGDFTGALILVPLALAWYLPPPREWWRERRVEGGALLVLLIVISELSTRSHEPLVYLVFPVLVWAALRFGQRGATVAVAVAVGVAVWNSAHSIGPFSYASITPDVLSIQLFIAVAAVTTFCLAAVVSEREAFGVGLRASRARLVEASDTERRRIVRNLHDGAQQRLSALAVHVSLAADDAPPGHTRDLFERTGSELSLAIEELRELAHGLPPALLTKLGLAGAIRSIAVRSTVPVSLLELPAVRVDDTAEATAYYVIAEAVTNAQRYAHATEIEVIAVVGNRVIDVTVADNGVGGATEQMSSGLQGLRDRVEAIGGAFGLESPAGLGTRVTAAIPAMASVGSCEVDVSGVSDCRAAGR
jgi:signal transduction histidine kinase